MSECFRARMKALLLRPAVMEAMQQPIKRVSNDDIGESPQKEDLIKVRTRVVFRFTGLASQNPKD